MAGKITGHVVRLVFDEYRREGRRVDNPDSYKTDFHGGSTFDGVIYLDDEQVKDFQSALGQGFQLVFWIR